MISQRVHLYPHHIPIVYPIIVVRCLYLPRYFPIISPSTSKSWVMGYPHGLLYKVVGWFIELVYTPTYEISTTYRRFEGEHSLVHAEISSLLHSAIYSLVHSDICGHTHLLVCLSWHLSAVSWSALYLVGPRTLTSHRTPPHVQSVCVLVFVCHSCFASARER